MSLTMLAIIVVISCIQSIFGVGVLLFGTPLLLLLGYSFVDAVMILLPMSLTINLMQIARGYGNADWEWYKKVLLYAVPFVVVCVFVVSRFKINMGMAVGAVLLLVAAKDYSRRIDEAVRFLVRYEKLCLITMGIIHGLTNLGGSLLVAIVHSKGYEKSTSRATVALSYATFAVFQLATLLVSGRRSNVGMLVMSGYVVVSVAVFIVTEKVLYIGIDSKRYARYFGALLCVAGILLIVRSMW